MKDIVRKHGVTIFSTNMQLYAAMSKRVTNILRKSIHHVENYSIDESFCDLQGYESYFNLVELMRGVADRIKLWTDIPVSVGIAPTKTLAVHSYDIDPHSYDVDPLEEGRAFKEQSLFACKQAAA